MQLLATIWQYTIKFTHIPPYHTDNNLYLNTGQIDNTIQMPAQQYANQCPISDNVHVIIIASKYFFRYIINKSLPNQTSGGLYRGNVGLRLTIASLSPDIELLRLVLHSL